MFVKWVIVLFADVASARNIVEDSRVKSVQKIWTINSQSGHDVDGNIPQAGGSADDELRRIANNASGFNGARPKVKTPRKKKDKKNKKDKKDENSKLARSGHDNTARGASTTTQGQTSRGHPCPQGESRLDQVIRAELGLSSRDNTANRPQNLRGAHGGASPSAMASYWARDIRSVMRSSRLSAPTMRAASPFENPQIAPIAGDEHHWDEIADWMVNLDGDDPLWGYVNDLNTTIHVEREPGHISLEEGVDCGGVTVDLANLVDDFNWFLSVLTGDEEPDEDCAQLAHDFLPPEAPVVKESPPIFTPVRLHYTSARPSMIACISSGRPVKTVTGGSDEWVSTRVVNNPVTDDPRMWQLDEVAWHDMVPWGYTREMPRDWEPVDPGDTGLTGLVRFSNGEAGLRILDERMNPLIIIFSDPRHFDGNHQIVHRDRAGNLIFHVHSGMGIYYPGEAVPFTPSAMGNPHRNLVNEDLIGEYHYIENRGFTGFWLRNSGYFRPTGSSDIAWEWRITDGIPTPELESHMRVRAGVVSDCPFCTAVDKALLNNEQHEPQEYVNKRSRLGAQRQQEAFEQWKRSATPETRASGTKRKDCICIVGDPARKSPRTEPPPDEL